MPNCGKDCRGDCHKNKNGAPGNITPGAGKRTVNPATLSQPTPRRSEDQGDLKGDNP